MGVPKVSLSQRAYVKLLLHSLKHPSAALNGALVGKIDASSESVEVRGPNSAAYSARRMPLLVIACFTSCSTGG